jgi:hypothetical protein
VTSLLLPRCNITLLIWQAIDGVLAVHYFLLLSLFLRCNFISEKFYFHFILNFHFILMFLDYFYVLM